MYKVLVVDDDAGLRLSVKTTLSATGLYDIEEAVDGVHAIEKTKAKNFDIVFLDVDMPRLSGLDALSQIKEHDPSTIVIVLTAFANIDDAVRAVKEGAYNYISKPIKAEELTQMVDKALHAQRLISDVAASAPILMDSGRKIIGGTAQMKKVFNIINRLSKVDTPVLIRGASGTGKELVARAIHSNSAFKNGHFVAINCSAIPENLFESELFGHEKGSFTGADQRKIGKFQFAEGGTIFLDELGDLPILMQVKLLRVLQEKTFTPVGSNREIEAHVRIIAATNRPLEQMIKDGKFREDLYYRLNVMPIFLPSLRERREDLEVLINLFVKKFNRDHQRKIIGVTPECLTCLKKYDWPGNIRELENVIEHAFILEEGSHIGLAALPDVILEAAGVDTEALRNGDPNAAAASLSPPASTTPDSETGSDAPGEREAMLSEGGARAEALDFNRQKEEFEREFIIKALKTFNGRINQTALHANIPKKTLLRKIEKYGINPREFA
jgi:DNA-binding NtrC family response regulator